MFVGAMGVRVVIGRGCVLFRDLLSENNQLAVPILDALTNLNIRPDLLAQVLCCR